jgi:DNA-binding IclR family transcriptional regulator
MARAAEAHGAAFFLARLRGPAVEIVHVETPSSGVSFLHPGLGRRPLHACSCGKAVAAVSPGLDAVTRLKRYTDRTLTRPEEIRAELEAIRRRGYAECVEELERGMCSVATTLGPSEPGTAISIGATGSARVFTPAFRSEIGAELVRMAGAFSAALFRVERAA